MIELTVKCVLRIIAVVTVLIGVTWITSTILLLANASRVSHGIGVPNGMGGEMVIMALIVPVVVVTEGVLLWLISDALARRLVA